MSNQYLGTSLHRVHRIYKLLILALVSILCTVPINTSLAQGANRTAVIQGAFDVGVIPTATGNCPTGSELIRITMDDEDYRNKNNSFGFFGAISQDHNYTHFYFCRVDGSLFARTANSYAVLRLGEQCPNGSEPFERYFDNEDSNNKNSYSGNIYPNESGYNTRLRFCLFKALGGASTSFPFIGKPYGVFAAEGLPSAFANLFIHTDDQDSGNQNSYVWLYYDQQFSVYPFISGTTNTDIRIAFVI